MNIPDPAKVDPEFLARTLRIAAEGVLLKDGDRDHMNESALLCEQTVAYAAIMLVAADKLDLMRAAIADRDNAEMIGLRSALTAMTIASAIPAIEDEYDFGPAITEVSTLLGGSVTQDKRHD